MPKIDILETVKRCNENPKIQCCSKGMFRTTIILWHLITAETWLTTKEICKKTRIKCTNARPLLYRLKKYGLVKTSKLIDRQTIWRINNSILKNIDIEQLKDLLRTHYRICLEYYNTGVLKKPESLHKEKA